jgi:hypothetical protein
MSLLNLNLVHTGTVLVVLLPDCADLDVQKLLKVLRRSIPTVLQ